MMRKNRAPALPPSPWLIGILCVFGLGALGLAEAGSLNKYRRSPTSGFTPLQQPFIMHQPFSPAQSPVQAQVPAPEQDPVLDQLKSLDSPLYDDPKRLIQQATQAERLEWLELYQQRTQEAADAGDMRRWQYYVNLHRFTQQEIQANEQ